MIHPTFLEAGVELQLRHLPPGDRVNAKSMVLGLKTRLPAMFKDVPRGQLEHTVRRILKRWRKTSDVPR